MPDAFTSLLSALAPALGLPEIAVREDDPSCLLVIDDFEVSLRWLPEADMVMMFTVVAPLPLEGRGDAVRRAFGRRRVFPRHAGLYAGRAGRHGSDASGGDVHAHARRLERGAVGAELCGRGFGVAGRLPEGAGSAARRAAEEPPGRVPRRTCCGCRTR